VSGILDNKTRILDTIITQQGREQLSMGKLKIRYVSFTDCHTFYKADIVSGTQDAASRIYLESCCLPQDQITFEADDSGKIMPFGNSSNVQIRAGQAYHFTPVTSSFIAGNYAPVFYTGDEFASLADDLLASSIDNFTKLQLVGTFDKVFDEDGFGVSNNDVTFVINNNKPVKYGSETVNLTSLDSLFNDARFSNLENFKFLPPINKIQSAIDKSNINQTKDTWLGHYKPLGRIQNNSITSGQIEGELAHYEQQGFAREVYFEPTSKNNRLMLQFFEVTNDTMKKLDVVDFGVLGNKKYFFVGKIFTDANNVNTFVHLFTMVFS